MKGQSKLIERGKKHADMLIEAEKAKQISEEAKSFLQASFVTAIIYFGGMKIPLPWKCSLASAA